MKPVPVICAMPHPKITGWRCNGTITRVVPGTVRVEIGVEVAPGCSEHKCKRCGTVYVVCPVERVA